jgi:hypothetical protein
LDDVRREFPEWRCSRGNNGLCYAQHRTVGTQVAGEDPLDLSDQIKAAGRRWTYGQREPEAPMHGPGVS